jgi:hypothetical protein
MHLYELAQHETPNSTARVGDERYFQPGSPPFPQPFSLFPKIICCNIFPSPFMISEYMSP